MSQYLNFGKALLVVTNEPESSPSLQLLFKRVTIKDKIILSLDEATSHLNELDNRDATVIFLINHYRGSVSTGLPQEVLGRTTFAPLPEVSKNTAVTICHRRPLNRDLLEAYLVAPDSSRLEKELKRFLNVAEPVPYFRKIDVLYCAIIAPRPEYAERFISSRSAIEPQVFTFGESESFLAAAQNNSEVYIVDRQDPTPISEALLERMPLNPFSLRANEVVSVRGEKEGKEAVILYSAPCERFLLPLLAEEPPQSISLPDLSGTKALAVSDLFGGTDRHGEPELVRQSSPVLMQSVFDLCQKKSLALVERRRFQEVAEELGLQNSTGLFDEATAAQMGKLVGAQAILLAEVPSVVRRTDHNFSESRARDGTREKWAWHWSERAKEQAEVTLSLRLVSVESSTQVWYATVTASQAGTETEIRSEAQDEIAGKKPDVPSWFRSDYSVPQCSDELVSPAVTQVIGAGVERFEQEVLWPTDLLPTATPVRPMNQSEIVGRVRMVEKETVFIGVEKGIESLRPGAILYVVRETKVGPDTYQRKKATLVVKVVKTESAECTIQSLEPGESIEESDLVTSRPGATPDRVKDKG
jgi:hypothetical protein